ncbi:MAG: 2OG-Fe(II) oxygenase family protein [Bdellovibrionota bacterium]
MHVKSVDYKSPNAAKEFKDSICTTGFAVVANHPISHELIFKTFEEWKLFFEGNEKTDYVFNPKEQAGYFPMRSENAKDSNFKDLKEFYHYYSWYKNPKSVSNYTPKLRDELVKLAATLLNWIEKETPKDIAQYYSMPLSKMIENSGQILLRPIHYPPLKGDEIQGEVRAAAHEDINLITLLPSATAPGLEVLDLQGSWHEVKCDPGTIVVNSGDMLKEASNGYYPSTTHRVINPKGEAQRTSRYSMPLFLHPREEVRLSERHTAESYLHERLVELGLKK